jgi:hypothetical protein
MTSNSVSIVELSSNSFGVEFTVPPPLGLLWNTGTVHSAPPLLIGFTDEHYY